MQITTDYRLNGKIGDRLNAHGIRSTSVINCTRTISYKNVLLGDLEITLVSRAIPFPVVGRKQLASIVVMLTATGQFTASLLIVLVSILAPTALWAEHHHASSAKTPKVVSIVQVTHDGIGKTSLLSDDSNLYVTEWPAARHVVAKVSLRTANRTVLSTKFSNIQAFDISPDRNKLLIAPLKGGARDNEFWTLPVTAGTPQRLGRFTGRDAAWSADGLNLTFGRGSSLYLADADGSSAREIFKADGSVFAPRISPDNKRIRFSVSDTAQNTTSLWEIGIDGSNPHALLAEWQGAKNACCGNWIAGGRYYVFQVTQSSPATLTTLWAIADSKHGEAGPVQLTKGPISFGNPTPSREDKKIFAIGVQPAAQAVKYSPTHNKFVPLLTGVSATDLDYSPDGKWVTYVSIPDGELYRSRADGREQMRLTSSPERAVLPRWSKDSTQIAYVSMQPGKPWRISIIARAGGASQDILEEDQGQIDANWSPDGSRIMYGYVYGSEHLKINILDLKTHEIETVPGSDGLFSPRWSPNGRYIAALTPDFTKVMLFDFQTKKWKNWLTEPAGAVSYPVWSADSKYLYFDDLVTDEESIRRVRVGEKHTERVFKLAGIERYPGAFGLWAGQMPDGSWMFVRDRSTQEVYQLSLELP